MNDYVVLIFKGYLFLAAFQVVLWGIQLFTKNASSADVGWSLGMPVLAGWYALNLEGYGVRKWLIFIPIFLWSLRLSFHLLRRIHDEQEEDSRYAHLREQWGQLASRNFFFIYQLQPVFNLILSVPFFVGCLNETPSIQWIEMLALLIWVVGLTGESMADEQLRKFKAQASHKGKICQEGFWYYSRHPNLFFEWVMWVAYFIFALGSPHGLWSVIAPLFMLFLLLKVTGVPLMEARALKNKGEAFKQYMQTTSIFLPLPKKVFKA
jgi:steroid 5-alpha reductase family enzyme